MNDEGSPVGNTDRHGRGASDTGNEGSIDRRRYLHLAGSALGALATVGVGADHVRGQVTISRDVDIEIDAKDASGTITVPQDKALQVHVGSNQYGDYGDLEDVLIDIIASGSDAIITSHGGSWVIRNVGVRGESNGSLSSTPMISAKTKQTNETGLIEHVYLGDGGDHGGHGPGRAGIHVAYGHRGTITVRRLYVANWTDNGVYGSSPGKDGGGGGVVEIENSYGKNNNIANFRIGTPGSSVRDCIAHTEGTQKDLNHSRGVWCRHRDGMVIENTDIDVSGDAAAQAVHASKGGSVTYRDSDYSSTYYEAISDGVTTRNLGTNPSTTPPEGVPMTPEEAASGGSSPSPDPNVPSGPGDFTISNRGYDRSASYEFTVDGSIEGTDSLNPNDGISGTAASGSVNGGADTYRVTGSIVSFSVDGPVDLYMSGKRVAPAAPNELAIDGVNETTNYEFDVSGELRPTSSLNATDEISGTSASGRVSGGTDRYRFLGSLYRFARDGSLRLFLNGTEVDPDRFARPANHLRIKGTGERSHYEFDVSGALEPGSKFDTDGTDGISGSAGNGRVAGTGVDDFYFDGRVVRFDHDGPLRTFVNGTERDPDGLGLPHDLSIVGQGTGVDYEFTVSQALFKSTARNGSINGGDRVNGRSATGRVGGGTDSYVFSGEITAFSVTKPDQVVVYLDGERVDPASLGRRTVSIAGDGTRTGYEFTVSGALEKSTANGGSINPADEVSGSTATGFVGGGTDSYDFTGEITDFTVENPAHVTVSLDGEQVAPNTLDTAHVLSIDGDSGVRVAYDLQVSGALEKTTASGGSINGHDDVSGSRATGRVKGGTDSYAFDGEIEYLAIDTRYVTVSVDGNEIDPAQFPPPNEITISNRPFDRPATYDFSVSGALQATDTVNFTDGDGISGTAASGRVNGGSDTYRFSGKVTDFSHDGPVEVFVNGKQVQ